VINTNESNILSFDRLVSSELVGKWKTYLSNEGKYGLWNVEK